MMYDVKSDVWEWITSATMSEKIEYFRECQDILFDELDDMYQKKYGYPYFRD